ncbi:MAG: glycosyltransferase family 4 protein [Acidimicrobiales bacterium]
MRLQIIAPHFAPDNAPTGSVISAITYALAELGHEMEVITSIPWYREHRIAPGWEAKLHQSETTDWGYIRRLHPFPTNKANIPARAMAFGGFSALAATVASTSKFDPQGVVAMSPPITLGHAGWASARRHRVPFVFNIQDVFPDVAVELGVLKGKRSISFFEAMERHLYRVADAVTVLSQDLADNVGRKMPSADRPKVKVIPNFVDTGALPATDPALSDALNSYRQEFDLVGKIVVMYAGNVGFSQSLELVLGAARQFRARADVVFVINGDGSARSQFEADASDLPNVRFIGYQPVERLAEVLGAGDIHLVPLKRGLAHSSVPSKFFSILAAGRPVLASVDPGTELDSLIDATNCGLAVGPDDQAGFTAALARLLDDQGLRIRCGRAGRAFVESWITPAGVAERYVELFDELSAVKDGTPLLTPNNGSEADSL